jgi:hypothetical protein|tara:strand:+ start:710 stop:1390 length:681 start_codon:yes stop_codon:yes gene_type:complete
MIDDLKKINEKHYENANLNELINFAIGMVSDLKKEIITEDIIVAAYLLFPKKFSMQGYEKYPDSVRINRRVVDLRDRGFIHGSNAQGYKLSTKGEKEFERLNKIFKLGKSIQGRGNRTGRKDERSRASRFLKHIKQSDAYKKFKSQKNVTDISEYEFRSLLMCPMETPPNKLRQSLGELQDQVRIVGNNEILEFLENCRSQFTQILHTTYSDDEIGGMMKQKVKRK